jgi:hypothetical protein
MAAMRALSLMMESCGEKSWGDSLDEVIVRAEDKPLDIADARGYDLRGAVPRLNPQTFAQAIGRIL